MLKIKIPVLYLVLSAIMGFGLTFLIFKFAIHKELITEKPVPQLNDTVNDCNYNFLRLSGFKYISPLISAEPECESPKYTRIKNEISNFIDNEEKDGVVTYVSVYLRDFTVGDWISINPDLRYLPGSLLKVGILITWLRMAENEPGLLNKELTYHGATGFRFPIEHYISDTVKEGRKYKVKDLLQSMIVNSDNRATLFLENIMDTTIFKKEFTDLGISEPRFDDNNYMLNVKEYSIFMKALYNATYLPPASSEYAISLLTSVKFKYGLVKNLPDTVKVAHKFGEAGDMIIHELHESGIVFIHNNPYLLTVMTQGRDWDRLSEVISQVSKIAFDDMIAVKP